MYEGRLFVCSVFIFEVVIFFVKAEIGREVVSLGRVIVV